MYMERVGTLSEEVGGKSNLSCTRNAIALSALLLLQGCNNTPTPIKTLGMEDFHSLTEEILSFSNGEQTKCSNTTGIPENITPTTDGVIIRYPKGSSTPQEVNNGYPRGGITALCPLSDIPEEAVAVSVSYTVNIPENFEYWKQLKLFAGICYDDCPRGGQENNLGNSIRIQTKNRGYFSTYIYGSENDTQGEGQHYVSDLRINEGGQYDVKIFVNYMSGNVRVTVGNYEIYEETRQDFIRSYNGDPSKIYIMFSTFFGGTPKDAPLEDTEIQYTHGNLTFYK